MAGVYVSLSFWGAAEKLRVKSKCCLLNKLSKKKMLLTVFWSLCYHHQFLYNECAATDASCFTTTRRLTANGQVFSSNWEVAAALLPPNWMPWECRLGSTLWGGGCVCDEACDGSQSVKVEGTSQGQLGSPHASLLTCSVKSRQKQRGNEYRHNSAGRLVEGRKT